MDFDVEERFSRKYASWDKVSFNTGKTDVMRRSDNGIT